MGACGLNSDGLLPLKSQHGVDTLASRNMMHTRKARDIAHPDMDNVVL